MPSWKDDPIVYAESSAKFEAWMKANHASSDGIWLAIAKKAGAKRSVSYVEAVEVALCWGWIDGQKQKLDDDHSLQRFTPRRPRSKWSKVNVDRVAQLLAAGRMRASGLAEVEKAKADGRWDAAYASPSNMTVPDDLAVALKTNKQAAAFFATISAANRYAILYRIQDAKKPETRAARVEKFVTMLAEGKTLH
ncbi:MAG: hypothetical protein QOJ00_2950 [Actinomycetota bacterium]|jgi:uncharacterized protein YdeI (YjbR/CyaY-like superfamily)